MQNCVSPYIVAKRQIWWGDKFDEVSVLNQKASNLKRNRQNGDNFYFIFPQVWSLGAGKWLSWPS